MFYFNNTNYRQFSDDLDKLYSQEFKIDSKNRGKLDVTRKKISTWNKAVKNFLKKSILPDTEFFINLSDLNEYSIMDDFRIRIEAKDDFDRDVRTVEKQIFRQKANLMAVKDHISICDTLNGKERPHIYSAQEKLDFVLAKLNVLLNDKFYSVENILKINGIDCRRGETGEIAILLSKKGYSVKKEEYKDDDDYIRITVKGSAYIERKTKMKPGKSKDESLNAKLDQVLINLQKLGFGQEIIFEELEEMREQIGKMSKKNWGQLLKGKLIDLAVGQVINKEVAGDVFRFLTDQSLNLLK